MAKNVRGSTEDESSIEFGTNNALTEIIDDDKIVAAHYYTYKGRPSSQRISANGMTVIRFKDGKLDGLHGDTFSLKEGHTLLGKNPDNSFYTFNTTPIGVGCGFSWDVNGETIKAILGCNVKLKMPNELSNQNEVNNLILNLFNSRHVHQLYDGTMSIKKVTSRDISDRLAPAIQYYVKTSDKITNSPLQNLQAIADSFYNSLKDCSQITDSGLELLNSIMIAFEYTDKDKLDKALHDNIVNENATMLKNNSVLFQLKATDQLNKQIEKIENSE